MINCNLIMNSEENEEIFEKDLVGCGDNAISDQLLPLNTAVIRRIRLNITTALSSTGNNANVDVNDVKDNHLIGSILQNTMKKKLANVLQSHSIDHNIDNTNNDCDSDSQLMSDIKNKWSNVDQLYEQLTKTTKHVTKMRSNVISLNAQLWNDFGTKMMEMRQLLNNFNQTQSPIKRTALKQKFIKQKKIKI